MKYQFMIYVIIIPNVFGMFCNYYPLDQKACIQKTKDISCYFNYFENACVETKSTDLGCLPNLNQKACLQQQRNIEGKEVKCFFRTRCLDANKFHLKNLDCGQNFSIFACVNLKGKNCIWLNDTCISYQSAVSEGNSCETTFGAPVTPGLCAQIQELPCYNNGFEGGYLCQQITEIQLQNYTCNTQGLNKQACIMIQTQGQKCIFINNVCRDFKTEDERSCLDLLNREACYSISNPNLLCVWNSKGCQNFQIPDNSNCEELINVNPSVCRVMPIFCYYNDVNHQCLSPSSNLSQTCNTKGINKIGCLNIKKQKCIYNNEDGCQEISESQLNQISCTDSINEDACINVSTPSQYCQWNGQECVRIPLNQDLNCPLPSENGLFYKVNGNVCQAISKQNVGCKYNETTRLCQSSTGQESCTTPYLNLSACVQISSAIACSWNEELNKCEVAVVIDQITKCSDLKYSNPLACSQITQFENQKAVGCYYNGETQQCDVLTAENLKSMECLQQGLNKFGCTMITKIGQRCRWFRGQCTSVRNKEQISQVSCLELKFVNPGTCGLATYQKEVCKYSNDGYGCVNSINTSDTGDYCNTLGLNSFACSQITRNKEGCYFDKVNNVCIVAPDQKSSDESVQAESTLLLNTAKCIASSPTKNICISIQTLGEQCAWNFRTSGCEFQYVQFDQKCLDYNTGQKQKSIPGIQIAVNANVCASIVMGYPNKNPKATNKEEEDPLRGYCQFDGKGNCIKFMQTPCATNCCTELIGINAHVCSRFTKGKYCYFNEFNKCVELTDQTVDTSSFQAVKDYYNFKQYKCSSMNKESCWMLDWSPTQQCYWDGLVCTQINFGDYPKFTLIERLKVMNRYGCQGIEGEKDYGFKYYRYTSANYCENYNVEIFACETEGINSNVCLRNSFSLDCKWDKLNLKCVTIDDYLSIYTCNEYQNLNVCIKNPYAPCAFLYSTDKCISSPQNINCSDFNLNQVYEGEVNEKACQNITKGGQICKYQLKRCISLSSTSQLEQQSCDLPGINSIGCYQITQGNCRWDPINLECYEEGDVYAIEKLKCSDYVNKKLCLSILNDNCEWSITDMKCSSVEQLKILKEQTIYNAQACTNLIGAAYYYSNSQCQLMTQNILTINNNYDCTSLIMNRQACLLNTKGLKCIFDSTQIPEKKCQNFKQEQLVCSSSIEINIEICMIIPSKCYFDESQLICLLADIQENDNCSTLIVQGLHYNKLSCSSISSSLVDKSTDESLKICKKDPLQENAQQCYFEKYCQWDLSTYGCKLAKIVTANYQQGNQQQSASCSQSIQSFTCQNIYSRAACLEFGDRCYFNIDQGGCNSYSANLYKVTDCSQINSSDCTKSKTPNAYCKLVIKEIEINGCEIPPTNKDSCESDTSQTSKSCSSLFDSSNESECAQADDLCYFNLKCIEPSSLDSITCSTPGVSKALCLVLNPPCDFSSGVCTPLTTPSLNNSKENYYYVCNEVNLLITNNAEIACGQISTAPCKYQLNQCQNAFYQSCDAIQGITVSIIACNQCQGIPTAYDYSTYQCNSITTLNTECDRITQKSNCQTEVKNCMWNDTLNKCHINLLRLNRQSCSQLTTDILAIWDDSLNQCSIKNQNQIQNLTECSILSRKACLIPSKSCWINSDTLECEYVTSIIATCQEINQYHPQSQHCLVSNKEACKWNTSSCVQANLTNDNCQVMNKFGCLNIQQKINCGWSDTDKKCLLISPTLGAGCIYYVSGNQQNYNQVNPYVCAQLTLGTCFLDSKSNKCTPVGNIDLYCSKHTGINSLACRKLTKDSCKFDSTNYQCVPTTTTDIGCTDLENNGTCCLSSLNQIACLSMPNAYCQFTGNTCSSFDVKNKVLIASTSNILFLNIFVSSNVCTYYNNNNPGAYYIYDKVRLLCTNIDKNSPSKYFAPCSSISISEKGCLEKTTEYCQYVNNSCQTLTLDVVKKQSDCNSAYSWKACISVYAFCKFKDGKCIPIGQTDTCSNLTNAIVGPQVCAQFSTPCKYDTLSFSCTVVLSRIEPCSSLGLSKSACLTYTTTSFCIFDAINYKCTSTYDNTLPCADKNTPKTWYINDAKCRFISVSGNYCQFPIGDQSECTQIPENQFTGDCNVPNILTNPITCRKATKQSCFYTPDLKKCQIGASNTVLWTLGFSFNKLACLSYDPEYIKVKLIWDEDKGCIELTLKDLANIQCSSPVNRQACISITNPTQFCQFNSTIQKCESFDYIIPPLVSQSCGLLKNVNRYEFCQYSNEQCVFNQSTRNCVTTQPTIDNANDCFNIGMSKIMCLQFTDTCKFNDERRFCYGGNVFCQDNTPQTCRGVKIEPCQILNNSCKGISFADLNTIECNQAVNQFGCTSITNPQKVCQYDIQTSICNEITSLTNSCQSYTYVNTNKACEQTNDVACKFDFLTKSCLEVSITDVFECDRGLNFKACTAYTRSSLQCKFGKYCYGPTTGISACSDSLNKEVCLNFNYQCTWDFQNSLCLDYNLNGQTCQQLQDQKSVVSSQVCYNAQVSDGYACIFDVYSFNCKIIQPKSCFELESKQQCQSQKEFPCIWLDSACQFFQALSTDTCLDVGNLGSKSACLSIFRKGQFCQYSDFNCNSYKENYQIDNCLDNINKIACISQQTSFCVWKQIQKEIFINLSDKISISEGQCSQFDNFKNSNCDSSLSYQACLSISTYGQYCRWTKGECQNIVQLQGVTILHNTYQLINQNACGLVNHDQVKYQEQTKSCQIIKESEIITCKCGKETKGLNKSACLSIKNESCKWISSQSRCVEYLSSCDFK